MTEHTPDDINDLSDDEKVLLASFRALSPETQKALVAEITDDSHGSFRSRLANLGQEQ